MSSRETELLDAALRVISRYGVRRTTMSDVADEAGVARQTLYNAYAGKQDLLRATIRHFCQQSMRAIEEGICQVDNLSEQFDIYFTHHAVKPFEFLHASPEAKDIVLGLHELASDELDASYEGHRKLLVTMLAPHEATITAAGLSLQELSDLVQTATVAAKRNANSMRHLRRLLRSLKVLVLNLVGRGGQAA
jgi:AcrR family transcriptional regulator